MSNSNKQMKFQPNILFIRLDIQVNQAQTMNKIKCIVSLMKFCTLVSFIFVAQVK
jgi:hypothetical protein